MMLESNITPVTSYDNSNTTTLRKTRLNLQNYYVLKIVLVMLVSKLGK